MPLGGIVPDKVVVLPGLGVAGRQPNLRIAAQHKHAHDRHWGRLRLQLLTPPKHALYLRRTQALILDHGDHLGSFRAPVKRENGLR
jgi:hypothetical protein